MKMHKIMYLTVAALLFLMPPVNAQDEESAESGGGAEAGEEKAAEDGKADKADGEAEAPAQEKKGKDDAEEKKTMFSDHQKRIKALRDKKQKLESSGARRSDLSKVQDSIKQEQKKMKAVFDREAEKIKTEIRHLKEQSKRSSAAMKGKLNEDLKKQEEALKQLEADADIKTWCTEPKEKEPEREKSKPAAKKQKKSKIHIRKSSKSKKKKK